MAEKIITTLVDDLDGSEARERVEFALDGISYEIDLSEDNASRLRDRLTEFVASSRRVGGRRRTSVSGKVAGVSATADREQNQAIRDWARGKGLKVSDRGRIGVEILQAYHQQAS